MVIAYVWLLQSVVRTAGLSMKYQFKKSKIIYNINYSPNGIHCWKTLLFVWKRGFYNVPFLCKTEIVFFWNSVSQLWLVSGKWIERFYAWQNWFRIMLWGLRTCTERNSFRIRSSGAKICTYLNGCRISSTGTGFVLLVQEDVPRSEDLYRIELIQDKVSRSGFILDGTGSGWRAQERGFVQIELVQDKVFRSGFVLDGTCSGLCVQGRGFVLNWNGSG